MSPGSRPGRIEGAPSALQRRRELLALEFPSILEFDDPSLEWRRLFAELLGTFFLVLVAAGASVVSARGGGVVGRDAAVVAPALMVLAIILFMGAVSGAHLNPVVTLAFALRRDFPWRRLPGYLLCQMAGAVLASLFLWAVVGRSGMAGATEPGHAVAAWQALLLEIVLTVGLVSTILGTASSAQNVGTLSAVGVSAYIALAGLWSSPISGASMNPARSFGPDVVRGDLAHYWIYVVGPTVGSVIAVGIAWILRGPGGDDGGRRAGSGTLSNLASDAGGGVVAPERD